MLKSMHSDWFICQSKEKKLHGSTLIQLDFYNGDPDVLERCTFSFMPISQTQNKYMNCRNVAGPAVHPAISGQPLPHPPHLVPEVPPVPAQPSCIPVCPAAAEALGGAPTSGSTVPGFPLEPSITSSQSIIIFLVYLSREKTKRLRLKIRIKSSAARYILDSHIFCDTFTHIKS